MIVAHDRWAQWEEAQALQRAGRTAEALEAYRHFLVVQPSCVGAWADLGGLLLNMNRLDEASKACERALGMDAAHPEAQINLGCTRLKQERLEEAEHIFRQILAANLRRIDAEVDLSECLIRKGDPEDALKHLEMILSRQPDNFEAFNNLAYLHSSRGDWEALGAEIERRLRAMPGCPEALLEQSYLNLRFGKLPLGWEQYEVRFQVLRQFKFKLGPSQQPVWDGEPFPGKTVLLHWEQGFGDTLMFIRFAPLAKARGGQVVVVVQAPLVDLVGTCPGVDQVVAYGDPLPSFDFHLSLLSLPRVFRTSLDEIPGNIPYLDVPGRVPNREWLAQVLAASEGRTRIGYAWAGNSAFRNDKRRSIAPSLLAPLAELPGVAWHSFQLPETEVLPLPSVSLAPLLSNFSDTAYALSGMDLVITVDTALAHAAGALGIPTLLMLPFFPDWRWLLERSDSPWYPTMRIYRQPRPGDWESVIGEILRDLGQGEA